MSVIDPGVGSRVGDDRRPPGPERGSELHFVGLLRSPASWAKVARELLRALLDIGQPVSATEWSDDRHESSFPLPDELEAILTPSGGGTEFTFSSPRDYARLLGAPVRIGLLVYEGTSWPPQWVRLGIEHLDRAVVPSRFCLETLAGSGYPRDRISRVPHGIDPGVFQPGSRTIPGGRDRLTILFVGTPARRKGLDILLDAFPLAFGRADPVDLVIKTLEYPDGAERKHLDHGWRERVEGLKRLGYRVDVITEVTSESELARLYRSADLLCQPFRAEGFGMTLLEAMACGTPVLCTGWSGPMDFVDETVGYVIGRFRLVPGNDMLVDYADPPESARVAEPELAAVAEALRRARSDKGELAARGQKAARRAALWTWREAARCFLCVVTACRRAALR